MNDLIKIVEYYYAEVSNQPGEARRLLEFLSSQGVNLVAFTAFPVGKDKSQLDFFPENPFHLLSAAKDAGTELIGPKKAFLLQGEDRIGALYDYHLKLSNAGINVHASNGVSALNGYGYIIWVHPNDFEKAEKALRA